MSLQGYRLGQFLNRYAPITAWLPIYSHEHLRPDNISGATVWGVMVPVAMAYALMAGMPPEVGL